MPPPFKQINREQFAAVLEKFEFKRQIDHVHMHHTWRPRHSDYNVENGSASILGMYNFHTQTNGWSDIAQHITIAPDGTIWLGRDWNSPPASAKNHNGTKAQGPFMFEMIGDFDEGQDLLEGEQRKTVVDVIARVQKRFNLPPESLLFHSALSAKSCPGSSVDREEILEEVRAARANLAKVKPAASRSARRAPFGDDALEIEPVVDESIQALKRPPLVQSREPKSAEPTYEEAQREQAPAPKARTIMLSRDSGLSPQKLAELRPHLVNLNLGLFSSEGEWKTERGDVDAIFGQHLERALTEAKQEGQPLRILFFAHGGLVKESEGLDISHKHLEFFLRNGIYPIFFVWETGFFETIGQLLRRSQEGTRGFVSDRITDPVIEALTRTLGGPTIWGGMKTSAERAVADKSSVHGEGGANYVAQKLKAFCDAHSGDQIELHALGHSAGAIFHCHFISLANKLGVPSFKSLQLLAPAVRVDIFKKLLGNLIGAGKGIDHVSLFTMSKDYERNDNCASVYRKSLLYLIYYSLEPERHAAILGLEQNLREDPALVSLFGLASATGNTAGDVVFSVTRARAGASASASTTHGGFDDDAPTLGSVARRILGKSDADAIVQYVAARELRGVDQWANQVDWPEGYAPPLAIAQASTTTLPSTGIPAAALGQPTETMTSDSAATTRLNGKRHALCIGINQYPTTPLRGCVADAQNWSETFTRLGFETRLLTDSQATRTAILQAVNEMIGSSAAGDVVVIQYAGHGTQLPDVNGDDSDKKDEALCPIDFASGAFLIDDDIREAFSRIPDGVNLTCFFDCCHSGTISRFAVGAPNAQKNGGDRRPRFIAATDEMIEAHRKFRVRARGARAPKAGNRSMMKNIAFAACQDNEVAFETNGHGDFTQLALRVLGGDLSGMTNQAFQKRVIEEFGADPQQLPRLDCTRAAANRPFLQPLSATGSLRPSTATAGGTRNLEAIALLEAALQRLKNP